MPTPRTREELLAARAEVARSLDNLNRRYLGGWAIFRSAFKDKTREELQAILNEIDAELREMGAISG